MELRIATIRSQALRSFSHPKFPASQNNVFRPSAHQCLCRPFQPNAHTLSRSFTRPGDKYRRVEAAPNIAQQLASDPTLDRHIKSRTGHVVGENGELGEEKPMAFISQELARLNNANPENPMHLKKVGERDNGAAVCKFIPRKILEEELRAKQRAERKGSSQEVATKQVEMTWRISPNDLMYRLKRIRDFLGDGKRVEVLIAPKKRSLPVAQSENEEIVAKINEAVEAVPGASVWKEAVGHIGKQYTLYFKGTAQPDDKQAGDDARNEKPVKGVDKAEVKRRQKIEMENSRREKEILRAQRKREENEKKMREANLGQ